MNIIPEKRQGFARVIRALTYSWHGVRAAFQSEPAFRQEVFLTIILLPLAFWVDVSDAERVALIIPIFLMLITELVNTAIETLVERISPEWHDMSKKAKDIGSAIVLLSLVLLVISWAVVLL
jgi:diacylglycerol kinase (ATP)